MRTMVDRRTILKGSAAAVLFGGTVVKAQAQEFTLGLSMEDVSGSRQETYGRTFIDLVRDYSDERIKIDLYMDAQLGSNTTVIEGQQIGTHDMNKVYDAMSPLLPELAMLDLPYLFKDRKRFERVMNDPVIWKTINGLQDKGIVPLSWWENGYRHMTNNVRPIVVPEDLNGLKMRTPPNPSRLAMFRLFGANPAPLPYPELYSALQQGTFDGQENPLSNISAARFYEVQGFLSLTGHVYNPQLLTISKVRWDSLPDWAKDAIQQAGDEVGQLWRDEGIEAENEDLEFLSSRMEVNEIDFNAFQAASQPLYDASNFPDLVARVLELVRD